MPKRKPNKSLLKRFRITKNGKILRRRAGKSHILAKKNRKRKRRLGQVTTVAKSEIRKIQELM
ncbi:MAG: 50S ribosomal protein L35 [Planctomycetota bacterium]|nr:MAG: 50S ribosomal protein L35 [Planctomycetota bacterium]